MDGQRERFVAECFWPGVEDADLEALDRRVEQVIAAGAPADGVRYLGSLLLRADEVVLCEFEGSAETIRKVAEHAEIPFERILAAVHSQWPLSSTGGSDDS